MKAARDRVLWFESEAARFRSAALGELDKYGGVTGASWLRRQLIERRVVLETLFVLHDGQLQACYPGGGVFDGHVVSVHIHAAGDVWLVSTEG